MDKNTLSNYGWIVIAVLVLSVMIALATPFGQYIENGVRSTTAGLFETSEKALNVVGMSAGSGNFEDGYTGVGGSGNSGTLTPEYDHNAPELHLTGTIPEGAYYVRTSTTEFLSEIPSEAIDGDVLLYGDYLYIYNSYYTVDGWQVMLATEDFYWNGLTIAAFIPNYDYANTTQSSYDEILTSIGNTQIKALVETFMDCTSLTTAPKIPSSVKNMSGTFMRCTSLNKIEINANPIIYDYCFASVDMSKITITGSITNNTDLLNAIGSTGNNWTPIE